LAGEVLVLARVGSEHTDGLSVSFSLELGLPITSETW
jgi:hypothetical protein